MQISHRITSFTVRNRGGCYFYEKKIYPEAKTQIHSVCTGLKKGPSWNERSSFLPCSEKVLLITLSINEQKVPALLDLARQCKLAPLEGRSAFSSNEFCVFYGNPSGEKAVQNLVYSRIFKESRLQCCAGQSVSVLQVKTSP